MAQVLNVAPPRHAVRPSSLVVLNIGLIAAGVMVLLSGLTRTTSVSTDIGPIPIMLALIALAIGIPHGAVDNLTLTEALTRRRRLGLTVVYLAVAASAALAIYVWPGIAFVLVVLMTIWHFGSGDVEAIRELRDLPPVRGPWRVIYAFALGGAPVLLPLTSPAAVSTLVAIEPALATVMTHGVLVGTRIVVLTLVVVTLLWLINAGDIRGAIELLALSVLGFIASPLLAFAIYFGFWHALRHTARLAQVTTGEISARSIARVTRVGLPSLIGFLVVVVLLAVLVDPSNAIGPMLWIGLVVIWGLTVPHMMFVARFDARMRRERS
jgi:Brp/Blh family beta-carotene 15,15'-monooxygenase